MAGKDENTYGFAKADADALVGMIGMGEEELPTRSPRQVTAIIIQTPAGGIPARVGTTVGKADCESYRITEDDELEPTGITYSVVNITASPVEGDAYGQAKRAAGRWVIDVEECEVDEPSSTAAP